MRISGFGQSSAASASNPRSSGNLTRRVIHHARLPALHIHSAKVRRQMPNVTPAAAFGPRFASHVQSINVRSGQDGAADAGGAGDGTLPDCNREPVTVEARPIHVMLPAPAAHAGAGADNGRTQDSSAVAKSNPHGQADVRGSVIDILA